MENKPGTQPLKIAMLASCTIDLLKISLIDELTATGFQPEIWSGGFGQYKQEIILSNSSLFSFSPTIILLYIDGEDLFFELIREPFRFDALQREQYTADKVRELIELIKIIVNKLPETRILINSTFISPVNILYGLDYNSKYSFQDVVYQYNNKLREISETYPNVVVIDVASLVNWMGYRQWFDPRLWYLARIRWGRDANQSLSKLYASAIASMHGQIKKCMVLDLDNTLWGGVIGEDGISGIKLGQEGVGLAYSEFQNELLLLLKKGIILAICSKNNFNDVLEVFKKHPSMKLKIENFAAMRINWDDKATNIRSIAEELNIGLDSIVFIDDSPIERVWVQQQIPLVCVPDWNQDPSQYKFQLAEIERKCFFMLNLTDEDIRRGDSYKEQTQRKLLQKTSPTIEDFYQSLEMKISIGKADSLTIPRIAQLTQKTNQFNLTTRRYSELEIAALSKSETSLVFWLSLDDRFGPNGLTGIIMLRLVEAETWIIDTFLLSCRIMGRTVENAFWSYAANYLKQLGSKKVIGEYIPTKKNQVVADLYTDLGFQRVFESENLTQWEIDLDSARFEMPKWFFINGEE